MSFQDWDLPHKIEFNWRKGTALPASVTFNAKIRDIIGTPEAVGFSNIKLVTGNHNHPAHTVTGSLISSTGIPITTTGVNADITVSLNPIISSYNFISLYEQTNYVSFYIIGQSAEDITNNTWTTLSAKPFGVAFSIYLADQPMIIPKKVTFEHHFQTSAPAYQNIYVDAPGAWEIHLEGTAERYDANGLTGGVTVQTFTVGSTDFKKIVGSGSGSFEIRPSQDYLNTLVIGNYTGLLAVGYNPLWYNRSTQLAINIVEATEVVVVPNNLSFHAIKTVFEAPSQNLEITSDFDFTLDYPSWVILDASLGTAGTNNFTVNVLDSDNVAAGTYQGVIKVLYDNGNGPQVFEVPITYLVDGFVTLPYDTDGFNFTLDNKMVSFFTELENTFYDVKMTIKVHEFFTGESKEYMIPFKIVLFNGRQKDNIGLKIHRVMKRISEIDLMQRKQYKTCEVALTVEEKDIDTLEIQRDFTLEGLKFIAGISPVLSNGMGILSMYSRPSRIFPNSKQLVNLLIAGGNHQVVILQNGNVVNSYAVNGDDYNVYMDYIDFSTLDAKEGDIFEYRLYTSNADFISKMYYVFPSGQQNLWVLWEDEYKLLSSMPFSGDYNMKTDFENKNFKRNKDLVEILENIQTNKDVKLSLNTGYTLKDEHAVVESLIRSRRAWLVSSENEVTELVPQSKSLTNFDSGRELISFDVEFVINRKTNEEIYMP